MNQPAQSERSCQTMDAETLIWSDAELKAFTHHDDRDIQDWALSKLAFQNTELARDQLSRLRDQPGVFADQIERKLIEKPDNQAGIQKLVDDIVRCDTAGKIEEIMDLPPDRELHVLRELGSRREHIPRILDLTGAWPGLFALKTVPYRWATDLVLDRLEEFLSGPERDDYIWETLGQLGDPRAIPVMLEHWTPGRKDISPPLYFLGRLSEEEDPLPDELLSEARTIRENQRKLENGELPRDIFGSAGEGHIDQPHLHLRCNRCEHSSRYEVGRVWVYPDREALEEMDWDGIVPDRVIECEKCGARDAYRVSGESYMELTGGMLAAASDSERPEWIQMGGLQLHDGTLVRRPSQGLEHLQELCEEHPEDREIWMRRGIFARRVHELDESRKAFERSLEIEEHAETLLNAADLELICGRYRQAQEYLYRAVRAFSDLSTESRTHLAPYLIEHLQKFTSNCASPVVLEVAWSSVSPPAESEAPSDRDPVSLSLSGVDLKRLSDWTNLEGFLSAVPFLELELIHKKIEEHPTMLERQLEGATQTTSSVTDPGASIPPSGSDISSSPSGTGQPGRSTSASGRRVVEETPGRNDPCHCGSGKKYKKCCWVDDNRSR